MDQAQQAELEVQARLQRVLQLLIQLERDVQVAGQVFFGEAARHRLHLRLVCFRRRNEARPRAHYLGDKQVAEVTRQLAAKVLEVTAVAFELLHDLQHPLRLARGERSGHFTERVEREDAEQFANFRFGQFGAAPAAALQRGRQKVRGRFVLWLLGGNGGSGCSLRTVDHHREQAKAFDLSEGRGAVGNIQHPLDNLAGFSAGLISKLSHMRYVLKTTGFVKFCAPGCNDTEPGTPIKSD